MRRATVTGIWLLFKFAKRMREMGGRKSATSLSPYLPLGATETRTCHLPLPYLLLPPTPSPAPASLGPATVLPSYAPTGAKQL
ncbi:hypothetical protein PPACK8108_LOCUS5291 [Phakopsora pachyrhizi]|uniref:Uncharacterized protein n=1 Tax=Phakopsora pachyrhizi TaxID=170000 RepID=A0AAV0AQ46_PHAPC|nr:hypothetical protein PPACK8108_LOCUS5291 [Phakopsora pachyrhizi]